MEISPMENTCTRCGEKLQFSNHGVPLPAISRASGRWGALEEKEQTTEALISILVEESGSSLEKVTEYVNHPMGHKCVVKERNCPECGNKLKTWRAKMCLSCGTDFEPYK